MSDRKRLDPLTFSDILETREARVYACPRAIIRGPSGRAAAAAGDALPLLGGPAAFMAVELTVRRGDEFGSITLQIQRALDLLERNGYVHVIGDYTTARLPWCGLSLDQPIVMGIVNVTPDSFSDGGQFSDSSEAIHHGEQLLEQGALILDVGGESTRPGAVPVEADEEIDRVVPVIEGLIASARDRGAVISVDTRNAKTMRAALEAGASIINDVTALTGDPDSPDAAKGGEIPVCLMHMQGEPQTMQASPYYDDVALDIYDWLWLRASTLGEENNFNICVDPGLGFGKTVDHNLELLDQLALFHGVAGPVMLGASRKSFIAKLSDGEPAAQRTSGSIATVISALDRGVQVLRVHDVAETMQAVRVWRAISGIMDD